MVTIYWFKRNQHTEDEPWQPTRKIKERKLISSNQKLSLITLLFIYRRFGPPFERTAYPRVKWIHVMKQIRPINISYLISHADDWQLKNLKMFGLPQQKYRYYSEQVVQIRQPKRQRSNTMLSEKVLYPIRSFKTIKHCHNFSDVVFVLIEPKKLS